MREDVEDLKQEEEVMQYNRTGDKEYQQDNYWKFELKNSTGMLNGRIDTARE